MRILLLNQTFHPDVVATAQYLTDFALGLKAAGHDVTVIASRRAYDDPNKLFPSSEVWKGVEILRIRSSGFGKAAKWRRALDFGTFLLSCFWRLLTVRRPDVVVALTSPPLISFIGACYARLTRAKFVYWVMDLNPDEAVAAGWLKPHSAITRVLDRLSRFSFQKADATIALDRFMADRIAAKGIPRAKIAVIPPWSHDDTVRFDPRGRTRFREKHGLLDKFVVMYSGNHSPCHPPTTLLEAARLLATDDRFVFLFVGGGSELPKVKAFAADHGLANIRSLPYQPLAELGGSLSAGDIHVVIMGNPFVGTIHPCKIYNILSVGAPVLYIGPEESHVCDIFASLEELVPKTVCAFSARHGEASRIVGQLRSAAQSPARGDLAVYGKICERFARRQLLPAQIRLLEGLVSQK